MPRSTLDLIKADQLCARSTPRWQSCQPVRIFGFPYSKSLYNYGSFLPNSNIETAKVLPSLNVGKTSSPYSSNITFRLIRPYVRSVQSDVSKILFWVQETNFSFVKIRKVFSTLATLCFNTAHAVSCAVNEWTWHIFGSREQNSFGWK